MLRPRSSAWLGLISTLCVGTTAWSGTATYQLTPSSEYTDGTPLEVAQYRVHWGCSGPGIYSNEMLLPAQALHTQTGLPDEGSCYFAFTALDAEGLESDLSNEIVKHFSFLPPGKPFVGLDYYETPVAIVIESATSAYSQLTSGGDITLNMPATRPDSDLYLGVIAFDGGTDVDTLAGWSAIVNAVVNGTSDYIGLLAKYGSSEPASYTVNRSGEGTERGNTVVLRLSGAHASAPIGATSSLSEGTGTTATAPAVNATDANSIILRIYAGNDDFSGFSGGTSVAISDDTTTTTSLNLAVAVEASPGNGVSTGTHTATLNSSQYWNAYTIEILPAAGGGGGLAMAVARHHYMVMKR